MLQNARVAAFSVSELFKENRHGGGEEGKITHWKLETTHFLEFP